MSNVNLIKDLCSNPYCYTCKQIWTSTESCRSCAVGREMLTVLRQVMARLTRYIHLVEFLVLHEGKTTCVLTVQYGFTDRGLLHFWTLFEHRKQRAPAEITAALRELRGIIKQSRVEVPKTDPCFPQDWENLRCLLP